MANPTDTIREALEGSWRPIREDGTYAHSPRYENALAALTELEQQLNRMTKTAEELRRRWDDETARAVAAETALAEANARLTEWETSIATEALVGRAEAAEQRANALADALRAVTEQQPKTVDWLRANGIVFDGPLGTDPDNWEHVAFSIYNDLCEADSVARAALDRHTHPDKAVT